MNMKELAVTRNLVLGLMLIFWAYASAAQTPPPPIPTGAWYYELGGADPYLAFSRADRTRIPIQIGGGWSLGGSCGFDPQAAFADQFENAKDALHNLGQDVLASVIPLARAAVLAELRKINPGLYDSITKGIFEAKESLNVAIKSCQDMNADVTAGEDPIGGWIKVSSREKWGRAVEAGENPAVTHQAILEGDNNGVTWIGDRRAGGFGQPPIELVSDTTNAGYEQWDEGADSNLRQVFPTNDDAREWVTAVVGEQTIRTCTGCEKIQTRIGQGLRLQYLQERDQVTQDLVTLLSTNGDIMNSGQLHKIGSPGMGLAISPQVITALQSEDPAERGILANRLAGEIALARTIEKALIARSLLLAGQQEPNIIANGPAMAELDRRIRLLNEEIENTLFEQQVRKSVIMSTPQLLLTRAAQRNRAAINQDLTPAKRQTMLDGAVPIQ